MITASRSVKIDFFSVNRVTGLYCHPYCSFIALQRPRNDFAVSGQSKHDPWNIERRGDVRYQGPHFSDAIPWPSGFSVCSTRYREISFSLSAMWTKRANDTGRRGLDLVGVVRRVFLTRLIGEVGQRKGMEIPVAVNGTDFETV